MTINDIKRMFENGNVLVCGLKGTGKDMLTANVVARRKHRYISNVNYTNDERYIPLNFEVLDVGKNSYSDFISGNVKKYVYPYEDNVDVYISDCGVYLPAQYCNELNKKYPYFPTMLALSRHLGFRVHSNAQAVGRMWDKIREQSETYILCRKCIVVGKIVIQFITLYDKYESAVARIKPCKISVPVSLSTEAKQMARQYLDSFENQHGKVINKILIYINKSNYNTRIFKEILANGT